jgi:hypothetical protein
MFKKQKNKKAKKQKSKILKYVCVKHYQALSGVVMNYQVLLWIGYFNDA